MEKVIIKDPEELKGEKQFASKYVSPFFRPFYLYRYQVLRVMNLSPSQARSRVMSELNIIWEKIGEDLQHEDS